MSVGGHGVGINLFYLVLPELLVVKELLLNLQNSSCIPHGDRQGNAGFDCKTDAGIKSDNSSVNLLDIENTNSTSIPFSGMVHRQYGSIEPAIP